MSTSSTNRSASSSRSLLLLLFLALAVRLAALLSFARLPFFTHHRLDAALYHEAAQRFARGGDLFGDSVIHMSPLYSGFLGGLYWLFGPSPWTPRLAQLGLGLITVALVYGTCRRLFGPRWALLGGALAALYGPLIFFEQQLSVATLSATLHAAVLWATVAASRRDGRALRAWAMAGALIGLAVLARPSALLLGIPALLLALSTPREHRLARAAALALAAALAISPATLRNLAVAGEPVLVSDAGGLNFYLGNGPGANGTFRIPKELPGATNALAQFSAFKRHAEQATARTLSSRELDSYWYGKTLTYMAEQPGTYLALLGRKALLLVHPRELSNSHSYDFHRRLNATLALPLVQYRLLVVVGLLGSLLMLAAGRREERFVGGISAACFAALMAFFVLSHYRVVVAPAFMVAGVFLARRAWGWWSARRWPALGLTGAAAAGVFALGLVHVFEPNTTDEYFKLGYAHHVQGEHEDAAAAYGEALARDADHQSSLKNLAVLREQQGKPKAALALWRRLRRVAAARGAARDLAIADRHIRSLAGAKVRSRGTRQNDL